MWETKSGLIKHGAIKKLSYTTDNLYTMPCGAQNKFGVLSHTLSKSPEKWSMDQVCNSNTQNKAHRGISNVYHHYPNSPHPNEMNSRNSFVPASVWIWAYATEEANANASEAAMMDGTRTGQRWRWLISLWGQRPESQPMWQRWGHGRAREAHNRAFITQQSHGNVGF